MLLPIIQIGHPVLRQKAQPLTSEDIKSQSMQDLIFAMQQTMYAAPGVGLAAPQVAQSLQVVVIEDKPEYIQRLTLEQQQLRDRQPVPFHVLINPKIIHTSLETVCFHEGCLSVSGLMGEVQRKSQVTVECLNETGQAITIHAQGWYARILQHEIDHLHGVLCIDRTDTHTLTTIENHIQYGVITKK